MVRGAVRGPHSRLIIQGQRVGSSSPLFRVSMWGNPLLYSGSACGVILSFMTVGGLLSSLIVYPVGVVLGFKYLLIILG